eukprot:CAMPEP_0170212608 /NCGR_PEP_ID=MMETSP0116_2-20130129/5922_1 /TAXON_ID=400756 /ORGANISM="Durinskia baltica, Strain CSIRO CS-38" /LENGTH=399 /DNA_ID=CAMNT_0010463147 /DNA_START=58 /DNA_END=1257 /DNA_ORIENTATION=-
MREKLTLDNSDDSDDCSDSFENASQCCARPVGVCVTLSLILAVGVACGLVYGRDALTGLFGSATVGAKARVHVLMMGMDAIPHPEIWRAFFESEPTESYSFFIHCKDETSCKESVEKGGLSHIAEVVPSVYNAWCDDLVSPMLQLLKYALAKEPAAGYPVDKFAFVSTEHLPLKALRNISEALGKRPDESDFCVHPTSWWLRLKSNNITPQAVTCYQWSVLSRKDAVTLRERMPDPSPSRQLVVPAVEGHAFSDFDTVHCIDESWLFATIFGLAHAPSDPNATANLTIPGFGKLVYPSLYLQGRCVYFGFEGYPTDMGYRAWVLWERQSRAAMGLQAIADSSFISPPTHCDATGWCEVIWTIETLGPNGLRYLRDSEYLFARKFADLGLFPDYASVVFS